MFFISNNYIYLVYLITIYFNNNLDDKAAETGIIS